METLVRAVGALASVMVLLFIVGLVMGKLHPAPPAQLPRGLTRPALAIELAKLDEVKGIIGDRDAAGDSPMRIFLRNGLYADYFFIALYWLLFAGMSARLAKRSQRWAVWAGVVAAVCATSAAIFDVVENLSIAALLDSDIQAHLVRNVTSAGFGKWLFISIATLVLSLVFLRRNWLALLGGLYFLIGIVGIYGLMGDQPRLVEWSFLLSLVGVLFVAVIFSGWPQKVLEGH